MAILAILSFLSPVPYSLSLSYNQQQHSRESMDDPSFLIFLLFVFFAIAFIYARRIENRRRRDSESFTETAAALTARVHALEQQLKAQASAAQIFPPLEKAPAPAPPPVSQA